MLDQKIKKTLFRCWFILAGPIIINLFLSGCAKEPQVYHVGILSGMDAFADTADGFKAKMSDLGYIEGENIVYDLRKVNVDPVEELRIAQNFVEDQVDLIFTFPTSSAMAAQAATQGTNIPLVFANANIEGNNLVKSIREPGGNITGVLFPASELTIKRLEFLHELAPEAERIYITYDSNYPGISYTIHKLSQAAFEMKLTLVEEPVTSMAELKANLKARSKKKQVGFDAILIMPTLLTAGPAGFGVIQQFASKHKLAVGGSTDNNTDMGAIFNFIPQDVDMGQLAAMLADKIFKGTPVGKIPIVTPEAHLRINYKALKKLGLKLNEDLAGLASEIIR